MNQITRKPSLYLLLMASIFMTGSLEASVKTVTGQLRLMATLDGKPAFRSVLWKLTRRTQNNKTSVQTLKRHTATVDLEPGHYQISVTMGAKTRTRQITIKESKKHSLAISLD